MDGTCEMSGAIKGYLLTNNVRRYESFYCNLATGEKVRRSLIVLSVSVWTLVNGARVQGERKEVLREEKG